MAFSLVLLLWEFFLACWVFFFPGSKCSLSSIPGRWLLCHSSFIKSVEATFSQLFFLGEFGLFCDRLQILKWLLGNKAAGQRKTY